MGMGMGIPYGAMLCYAMQCSSFWESYFFVAVVTVEVLRLWAWW
jgi:hypothetical protein